MHIRLLRVVVTEESEQRERIPVAVKLSKFLKGAGQGYNGTLWS